MALNQEMPRGSRIFFTRIFPWPFIIVGACVLYFGSRSIYRANESVSWPTAEGQIQNSSVEYHSGGDSSTYHAEIRYTFVVDGQTHSGNRVAFGDYGSSDSSHAQNIVNRYPKDKKVQVHYLASDPDVCVIEAGVQKQVWFVPAGGLVFFVSGTLMALFLPRIKNWRPT